MPASSGLPERTSLYPSLLAIFVPLFALAVGAYFAGEAWFGWLLAICLVIVIPVVPKRIDFDAHGMTYVPLAPLWRKQSFGWSEIGPFEQKTGWKYSSSRWAYLEAPLLSGRTFRIFGVWPSAKLGLAGSYSPSLFGGSMTADELLVLVATYRASAS